VIPFVVIVGVCVGAVAWHVSEFRRLGPLDEQAHLDYVNRLRAGQLPEFGERLLRETRQQAACRSIEAPNGAVRKTTCADVLTNDDMPENGNSYEATQPPLYYLSTAALSAVMPGDDVDSIRLTGGLWLAAGAVGLYGALRRLRVARAFATAAALVLALSPPLLFAASVVGNDIGVWTFGGLALWAVVTLMQQRTLRAQHVAVAAVVGAVGALIKPTALLVVAALALAVLLQQRWSGRTRSGWLLAGALVGGAALATGAWALVMTSLQQRALDQVQPWARYQADSLDFDDLFRRPLFSFVSPYAGFVPHELRIDWVLDVLFQGAVYLGVGLLLLPLLARTTDREARAVGLAYLVAVLISGPYYVIFYFVTTNVDFGAETRFVYGLLPMLGVMLGVWVARAWQRWTVAALLTLPIVWYLLLLAGWVTPATR
jgi:4-amino-4-deoxy-L-arabinose transferase-like glycosyltransferase